MIRVKKWIIFYLSILPIFFFFPSCSKPSYPKEKLQEAAKKILKKEYNLDGSLKLVGRTLYLEIELPELFSTQKDIPKKVFKKLQGAVLTIVRISLSSDAKIDTLVTIAKVKDYDFCVRIIQRLQDIKDFIYLKISKADYEDRLVFEMLPKSKINYNDLSIKEFVARLIVSQYNMLLKINPFLGAVLNNMSMEFQSMTNNSLIIIADSFQPSITDNVKELIQEILVKSYSDVLKKYNVFDFPQSIKIINRNENELLTINL